MANQKKIMRYKNLETVPFNKVKRCKLSFFAKKQEKIWIEYMDSLSPCDEMLDVKDIVNYWHGVFDGAVAMEGLMSLLEIQKINESER